MRKINGFAVCLLAALQISQLCRCVTVQIVHQWFFCEGGWGDWSMVVEVFVSFAASGFFEFARGRDVLQMDLVWRRGGFVRLIVMEL